MDKKINVLVVDDNPGDIDLLKEMLSPHSEINNLFTASKLSDALDIAKGKSPDLVILDLGLPDSQGADIL